MKRVVKVAAVQMYIEPRNIPANLNKAGNMLDKIFAKEGCDLIIFPEYCINGPDYYPKSDPQNENSFSIKRFKKLAIKFNTHIVCGSFTKRVKNKYFNTSLLINNKGKIILEYKKNNLWIPERPYITKGSHIRAIKTPIGVIGIIICWDLAFPKMCQKLAEMGADIICCPSYWTVNDGKFLHKKYGLLTENTFVNTLCPARAIENEVLFIYANGAGEAKMPLKSTMWKARQIGQTQICIPVYGTVAKINDNSEGFIIYKYDRQIAKDAERNYKIRENLD